MSNYRPVKDFNIRERPGKIQYQSTSSFFEAPLACQRPFFPQNPSLLDEIPAKSREIL
jgi:hypothetical protein